MSTFRLSKLDQVPAGPRTSAPPPPQRGSRLTERISDPGRWWEHALCKGQTKDDTSIWIYPWKHADHAVTKVLKTCAVCPVRLECRTFAPRPLVGVVAGEVWLSVNGVAVRKPLVPCRTCGDGFYTSGRSVFCSPKCRTPCSEQRCRKGHLFTPENSYIDPRGYRRCRECARLTRLAKPLDACQPLTSEAKISPNTNEGRNRDNGYGLLPEKPVEEAPRMDRTLLAVTLPAQPDQ